MEVQIPPALQFNGNQAMIDALSSQSSYGPAAKRFKSDLTFQCIVCSDVYSNPNTLYEHMKSKHQELYEGVGENCETDSEHELSDEEYLDLSRLLEPICELRQVDDDDDDNSEHDDDDDEKKSKQTTNVGEAANAIAQLIGSQINEEQLRFQLQLQMQLQSHLLQLQMNGGIPATKQVVDQRIQPNENPKKSLSLRKF